MHLRAFGEVVVLAVLADQKVEGARVLHRVTHDRRVHDADPSFFNRLARWEAMNPPAPVTTAFFIEYPIDGPG